MFNVTLTKKCSSDLLKQKKNGSLSENDLIVIRTWINEMSIFGPDYIRTCGHWNDHELKGNRAGQRSSAFSHEGRIIYKIKKSKVEISIIKITSDHDYK
jgi:mRNA-degrading endonuclease YafQ of YafQ-DinJ toxin-antitoxin module